MKQILIKEVIEAVGGKLNKNIDLENLYIKSISTDTRKIEKDCLFFALKGDNFDGHNFIENALNSGAIACISEKDIKTEGLLILVEDSKKALRNLAKYYRSIFDIKVVALTGSTGKTTTKDMLYSCISKKYNTVKTEGNFNNEIGLPLTVFNIEEDTQVLILEMGMNHFGEIRNLSEIAKPDIAIITNIGVSHIENLGSREGILKAKCEIFDYLSDRGLKILNADDDMLITLKDKESSQKVYYYSLNKKEDAFAVDIEQNGIEGIKAKFCILDEEIDINLNIAGEHFISNALAVALACFELGISNNQIKEGLESFRPSKMRMNIIKTDKYTIINDAYNANPNSMKAGLDVLDKAIGRKVAILGDMFELGEKSSEFHYMIGEYVASKDIQELICIGEDSKYMYEGALEKSKEALKLRYFKTQDEFLRKCKEILQDGDIILVKASRGMKLENTVDEIMR